MTWDKEGWEGHWDSWGGNECLWLGTLWHCDHVSPVSAPGVGISVSLKYHRVWLARNDLPQICQLCWELSSVFPELKLCRKGNANEQLKWIKTKWKDERNSLWKQGPQQSVHLSPCLEPTTAQQFNSISKMKLKWKQAAGECWVSSCWHYPWRCSDHDREVRMGWTEGWWVDKTGSHTSKSCRLPAVDVNMSILFYSFLLILSSLRGFIMIYWDW